MVIIAAVIVKIYNQRAAHLDHATITFPACTSPKHTRQMTMIEIFWVALREKYAANIASRSTIKNNDIKLRSDGFKASKKLFFPQMNLSTQVFNVINKLHNTILTHNLYVLQSSYCQLPLVNEHVF